MTHGFTLRCSPGDEPNNLQINWGQGNSFHLTQLATAECTDDPSIDEGQPRAGFDTFEGTGVGRFNQQPGYAIEFILTDAGEPGVGVDTFGVLIVDGQGNVILDCPETPLGGGNHQAHRPTGRR